MTGRQPVKTRRFDGDFFAITCTEIQYQFPALSALPTLRPPGSFDVAVQTPAGNTSNLGCSSGGTSSVRVLTVN